MDFRNSALFVLFSKVSVHYTGSQKSNVNYEGPVQEVSEEENVRKWLRNCCDILVKNLTAFCPYPKHLPEAKLKSFKLMVLVEEI